jgi:tripartite-type tricarboxylate transporter receptor subunit TctC
MPAKVRLKNKKSGVDAMQKKLRLITASMSLTIALATGPSFAAEAEVWPSKKVAVIVGYASGGFADNVARVVGRKLGDMWKQPVIIQNMAGAGGNIAARSVAAAAPDGYTLLATTTSLAINDTLYRDKGFRTDGLIAVAIPVEAPELLVANPKSGIKSFEDLLAKAKTEKIYLGSSGIGSGSHISAEYALRIMAKVDVKHIPFAGGNPAMLALMTGEISVLASTATAIPAIKSGELVGLAVGSLDRSVILPEVKTYSENGLKGFTASSWTGLFSPNGTPDATLKTINAAVNEAVKDPDVLKQLQTLGVMPGQRSQPESIKFFKDEVENWQQMVKLIGLSAD